MAARWWHLIQSFPRAVLLYVHANPHAYTHHIAREAGVINVPDVAMRIRPTLQRFGLQLVNYLPADRPRSRHGSPLLVHRWVLVATQAQEEAA